MTTNYSEYKGCTVRVILTNGAKIFGRVSRVTGLSVTVSRPALGESSVPVSMIKKVEAV